jgi:hypothetical protein
LDQLWDLNDKDNDFAFYRDTFTGKDHWFEEFSFAFVQLTENKRKKRNFLAANVPSMGSAMAVSIIRTGFIFLEGLIFLVLKCL